MTKAQKRYGFWLAPAISRAAMAVLFVMSFISDFVTVIPPMFILAVLCAVQWIVIPPLELLYAKRVRRELREELQQREQAEREELQHAQQEWRNQKP